MDLAADAVALTTTFFAFLNVAPAFALSFLHRSNFCPFWRIHPFESKCASAVIISTPLEKLLEQKREITVSKNRLRLLVLLLLIPIIGFIVSNVIKADFNSSLQSSLRAQFPNVPDSKISQTTVDLLCSDPELASANLQACTTNHNLTLLGNAAIAAAVTGLLLLIAIAAAAKLASNNRALLVKLFKPGMYATIAILVILIIVHAAIAMASIYYGESALTGQIHPQIIGAIGIGAVIGVISMSRQMFGLIKNAKSYVVGQTITHEQAPALWQHVENAADQLQALRPEHIVVGLEPSFFVTEADVVCLNAELKGRTLFCSLPLSRILSEPELVSVIGHELGHFKGMDTQFSQKFYPIYRGTTSSLAALAATSSHGLQAIALLPAVAVLNYFLERFAIAESAISRERELLADQAGASITSPSTIATALVKIHAFTGIWNGFQQAAAKALQEGKAFANASTAYADAVAQNATPQTLEGIADSRLSHPTDSHPPLGVRLDALQIKTSDVASDALRVAPENRAIDLIPEPEKMEEEISKTYQLVLAHRFGVQIPAGSGQSPE